MIVSATTDNKRVHSHVVSGGNGPHISARIAAAHRGNGRGCRYAAVLAAVFLLVTGTANAGAASVQSVRLAKHAGYTRFVIDLSAPVRYRVRIEHAPPQAVVELSGAEWAAKNRHWPGVGMVSGGTVEHSPPQDLRLRIDLTAAGRLLRVFRLEPGGHHGHRVVLDLAPTSTQPGTTISTGPSGSVSPERSPTPGPPAMTVTVVDQSGGAEAMPTPGVSAKINPAATVPAIDTPTDRNLLSAWRIRGSLAARVESYSNEGDPDQGIYFSEGSQSYYELDLDTERRMSAFEHMRFDVFGVVNKSDYRSADRGLLLEQAKLLWEKGDAPIPFRAEMGDHFGSFTFRTLQRSLKGAQIELQPEFGPPGRRNSLVLLAGTPGDSYREFDPNEELFAGLSWFSGNTTSGAYSVNLVHNWRDAAPVPASPRLQQSVLSAAMLQPFSLWGQRMEIEGELARFQGDGRNSSGTFNDRNDGAVFAQITGRSDSLPLSYSARFERYGEHFSPRGGVVEADRRNIEGRTSWQFERGPRLTLRAQTFRTGLESANPLDTETLGFAVTGPVEVGFVRRLSISGDAFVQRARSHNRRTDTLTRSARLDLSTRLLATAWTSQLRLFGRAVEDLRPGGGETVTREVKLQVQRDIQLFGDWAYLGPEMLVRRTRGAGEDSLELGPGVVFGISGNQYTFDGWWFRLMQDRGNPSSIDFDSDSFGMLFAWWQGNHYIELDANYDLLDPRPGQATKSYSVGARYSYSFDKAAEKPRPRRQLATANVTRATSTLNSDLLGLRPGIDLSEALTDLNARNISGGLERDGLIVYDTQAVFPALDQRQRLVVAHAGGTVEDAAIVIDLEETGSPESLRRSFERARRMLLDRYGPPTTTLDKGEFTASLAEDLLTGRFARSMDWQRPEGTLRFGIPRRRDRQVRMELHFSRRLPPARGGNWSIEALR